MLFCNFYGITFVLIAVCRPTNMRKKLNVRHCVMMRNITCRRMVRGSSSRSRRMKDVDSVNSKSQPDKAS